MRSGAYPNGRLVSVAGVLYGTTVGGGAYGNGTVFRITSEGKQNTLYSFHGYDGAKPNGSLLFAKGMLFGTTFEGGGYGEGTVFAMTIDGSEKSIYSFAGNADGASPNGGLAIVDGTLYGTTLYGGAEGNGTAFAISTSGSEHVLHSFSSDADDGQYPNGGLLDVRGTLYGTTQAGGASGNGTVFAISGDGHERVLYSFTSGSDSAYPTTGLTEKAGVLYGTAGGGLYGLGSVFSVSTEGAEKVLYSFKSCKRFGCGPSAALTVANGDFYGTTEFGGDNIDQCGYVGVGGCGTVFRLTMSGDERVLHSFSVSTKWPVGVIQIDNSLYGTTIGGGNGPSQPPYGTLFKLSP